MTYPAQVTTLRKIAAVGALTGAVVGCGSSGADSTSPSLPPGLVLLADAPAAGVADEELFAVVPDLLVTVDGLVIYAAPEEVAVQGELLPDIWVQELTPDGVDTVRRLVEAGSGPTDRVALQALVGAELEPPRTYLPDAYRFRAVEVGPESDGIDPNTPLIPWPDAVSTPLASASGCLVLPEIEVGELFETAAAGSLFVDEGIVYSVVAVHDWPAAPC